MPSVWRVDVLSIIGIVVSALAFINERDRFVAALVFAAIVVFYIIRSFYDDIEKHEYRLRKLEGKINIHKQLIDLKADVEYLKQKMRKNGNK